MLKSIVNGAEHDIVSIPMNGKNLAHANSDRTGSFLTWQKDKSTFTLNGSPSVADSLPFSTMNLKAGTYTLSIHGLKEIGGGKTGLYLSGVDTVRVQTNRTYTIMNDTTVTLRLVISVSDVSYDNEEITVMFNAGSTALPYEPYGYQNGWEVRDNQNRLIWGREDELQTTTGNLLFKGYDLPIKVNSLLGSAAQNGTPSPDNVVVPEFCGVRTKNICPSATAETKTNNGITAVSNGSGTYHVSGTATADADIRFNVKSFWIPQSIGNYHDGTFSMFNSAIYDNTAVKLAFYYQGTKLDDWGLTTLNRTSTTYAIMSEKDCDAIGFTVKSGVTVDFTISPEFTNDGVLPTEFEPYGYKIPFDNNGENLFDKDNATIYNLYPGVEDTIRVSSNARSIAIPCVGGKTYTVSKKAGKRFMVCFTTEPIATQVTYTNLTTNNTAESITSVAPLDAKYLFVYFYNSTADIDTVETFVNSIMLNIGSTPLPYSPYLNKTTPIYLGEVPTVRRIRKLVLTGEGEYVYDQSYTRFYFVISNMIGIGVRLTPLYCTHYQNISDGRPVGDVPNNSIYTGGGNDADKVFIKTTDYTSASDFKSYLTQQYQNGTPVTIWYILAEQETGIVNEPLAKIGNYADELTEISVHNLSAPLYGIGDYKDILNLSTGVLTRKIRKLVLDGVNDGEWKKSSTRTGSFYLNVGWNAIVSLGLCDRAVNVSTVSQYDSIGQMLVESSGSAKLINLWLFDTNISLDDFKAFLASEYAAGHPVTIWYVLSTIETETVTVPTGMTGEIEGYLTQISTPSPEHPSIPKWNGKEETGGTYAVTVYNLPEIPTTTGKNTLTVNTTLAPYDVTINGHIKYTYWGKIREDVRSGLAQTKFPVGTILYDNEDETTGRAFQVVGYDKHFDPSLTARGFTHSMTLCQLKLSGPWQFDAIEAFLYTTVEMQPGTYKFKIPNYDTAYGGNKTYYFTSTATVPVDSQIVLKWDYQKPPASVTAYAGPNPQTKTTAITGFNALTLTEWVEGESPEAIDLGTIKLAENNPDSAYGKLNHIHRARYGSNNYYQSGLRQLLNTDLASNNWWNPTTIFDRPYGNRTTNGYLRSLNEDFINVLATPEITHITNNVFEYPSLDGRTFALNTEYKINTDKVFLLSHTEVGLSSAPNVGTILDYYSTHNTNNDRIKYRIDNGNAYYWWFRTPYPSYANLFRYCLTSGALYLSGAFNSSGVAPAHIIQ